jgi:hypothetical protein
MGMSLPLSGHPFEVRVGHRYFRLDSTLSRLFRTASMSSKVELLLPIENPTNAALVARKKKLPGQALEVDPQLSQS